MKNIEISVILPCQNEELALSQCIEQIKEVFDEYSIFGEIIVSDSSEDNSPSIAKEHGVILIKHNKDGYGRAYLEGFKVANGRYIFCADPDGTYDFREIPKFLKQLNDGYDYVIGNRFGGKIHKGAMPFLHRYIGNPILSLLLKFLFGGEIFDAHCGMRAFKKDVLAKLGLHTTGMEFASEMTVQALRHNLKIKELPIDYYPRVGVSKLRTFSDGWRHLKFMFIFRMT